jgi:hypothetical protein
MIDRERNVGPAEKDDPAEKRGAASGWHGSGAQSG